ncbi:hypothetical protein [uncultured Psychrobacter sp.]|uniref:hypothetical protein n=1 Tax=uncultured Psychrobacter sp. TaxID=259303 RepID=UPI0034580CC6
MDNIISYILTIIGVLSGIFIYVHRSYMDRYRSDWENMEKLRSSFKELDKDYKYMQELSIYSVRCIRGLAYDEARVVVPKNISLRNITAIASMSKKDLCLYELDENTVKIVSEGEYKKIRNKDKLLWMTFTMFIASILGFLIALFISSSIFTYILLFLAILGTEVLWLHQENPYDYYKEIIKNQETIESLKTQNIVFVQEL